MSNTILPTQWNDYKWQLANGVHNLKQLYARLPELKNTGLEAIPGSFPLGITPYYLSLIEGDLATDPIALQCIPSPLEAEEHEEDCVDPLHEEDYSPMPGLTHRYPDRVLLLANSTCAMYCRHCTRKRKVGDSHAVALIHKALDYIKAHTEVSDVVISGGDPLLLTNRVIDDLLSKLRDIPHVETIRIGSRVPVTLPMRVNYELINILARYDIILCTQFNHPRELTDVAMGVCRSLANRGVMLLNQTPLLKGVNDDLATLKALFKGLIKNKIRPHYLFQCDLNEGTYHFRTNLGDSLDLVEGLIGHISSIAVPTFSVDLVGGGGKVPVLPTYMAGDPRRPYVKFHNYEMTRTYEFPNVPPRELE